MDQPNPAGSIRVKAGTSKQTLLFCLLLGLMTAAVYWPVVRQGFTNYDDPAYVSGNRHVQSGLTWESVRWAFTSGYAGNWHPLTWISHMLDCQLYGLRAGGHHLTNLVFHVANTLLLFLLLQQMTATGPRAVSGSQRGSNAEGRNEVRLSHQATAPALNPQLSTLNRALRLGLASLWLRSLPCTPCMWSRWPGWRSAKTC